MADFTDAIFDLLPEHSPLKNPDNDGYKVLSGTVGEWFDNHPIEEFYEQLFINTASNGYLDAFGKDYNIIRKEDETDEDYRTRIIQEKNDHLTPEYLKSLYGLNLFVYVPEFNPTENTLTSDNYYIGNTFMSVAGLDLQKLLFKKLVLDSIIYWVYDDGIDYIYDINNVEVLGNYNEVHYKSNVAEYFLQNTTIKEVKLNLYDAVDGFRLFGFCDSLISVKLNAPNLVKALAMFDSCESLTTADVNIPNADWCESLFERCFSLTSVNLNLPNALYCNAMLGSCTSLTNATVNIPEAVEGDSLCEDCDSLVNLNLNMPKAVINAPSHFIPYYSENLKSVTLNIKDEYKSFFVSGLSNPENYPNLEYLCVNGEVVDL